MTNERAVPDGRRIVIKIGSRSILGDRAGSSAQAESFSSLASEIAQLRTERRAVLLVSSGAIALGRDTLGFDKKPTEIALLQACAAVGQSRLMRAWEEAFSPYGVPVAQLLLTHADLADRERYLNARAALDALWELGAIPIINENDTVAVDEIKFGDNDQLAAMVATLAGADLLVLLTDVEGLLDEHGQRIPLVSDLSEVVRFVSTAKNDLGTGGMASKLEAARRASLRGVPVVIGDAKNRSIIRQIIAGEDVGTLVAPVGTKLASRKHWIGFTLRPRGALLLDAGAALAIRSGGRSLLPAGVMGVRGDFAPGDSVVLLGPDGAEIARGLSRYATRDVAKLAGANTKEILEILGFHGGDEIVHRDDLVVL